MKAAFIGDLHLDSKNTGCHKDYFKVCTDLCVDISEFIINQNITHLFFAGDLTNKNINDYSGLNVFLSYFVEWNRITNNNVYSLRGNHDFGSVPRFFQILETTGLIKTAVSEKNSCNFFDIGNVRIHFMNYSETNKKIDINAKGKNILLSHAYWITSEQAEKFERVKFDSLIISDTENIKDIDYIFNGHIHKPSDKMLTDKSSYSNKEIKMLDIGCPTRPMRRNNIWNKVFFPYIDIDDETGNLSNVTLYEYHLPDAENIYYETDKENNSSTHLNTEELRSILNEIQNIKGTDTLSLFRDVYALAGKDTELSKIIIDALEKCITEF